MGFKRIPLGQLLKRRRETVKIDPSQDYKLVTIRLYHKGVVLRSVVKGNEIKSPMSRIRKGDFILSGIDARNGAFGIVPDELDGALVTNDFWCLDPDGDLIDKEFLLLLTTTVFFDHVCKQSSEGTTQRIRLQKDKFFSYQISLPDITEQLLFVERFRELQSYNSTLSTELQTQLSLVKELRQAFLREAMEGKLCDNSATDETGQQLLEKIKAEKEQLIKEKKIKKEKPLPPIEPEEVPFEIPENWVWCRLGEICTKIGSGSTPKGSNYVKSGIPFFRSQNIYDNRLEFEDISYISSDVHTQMQGTVVYAGDILLNITGGSLGRSALVPSNFDEGNVSQHVCIIRPVLIDNQFLHSVILSPFFQNLIVTSTTGAGREGLPKYNLEKFLVPLPPLTVQERIVDKIEELTKMCDQLKKSTSDAQQQNEQLLQQVLKEALEAKEEVEV